MNNNRLFVGSISWNTTDDMLRDFFSTSGTVVSAKVIRDRDTNRSRGFGFVEMGTSEEADKAVTEKDGQELDGRKIHVSKAKPMENRDNGGNGNFRRDNRRDNRNNY